MEFSACRLFGNKPKQITQKTLIILKEKVFNMYICLFVFLFLLIVLMAVGRLVVAFMESVGLFRESLD